MMPSRSVRWTVLALLVATQLGDVRAISSQPRNTPALRVDIPREVTNVGPYLALALSPNGRSVVYSATSGGSPRLWLYSLDLRRTTSIAGTEGAERPFWSPDGEFIAYSTLPARGLGAAVNGGTLKKVRASGGPSTVLCNLPLTVTVAGTWNAGGIILLSTAIGPLLQVPAGGGDCTPATELDAVRNETSHRFPYFLPDGRHFLALAVVNRDAQLAENRSVFVGTLESRERRPLPGVTSEVMYSSGHIIFIRDGALTAQPFDPERVVLTREPFPLVERFSPFPFGGFSASRDALAYSVGAGLGESQLVWFDRNGKRVGTLGEVGEFRNPELSPDGKTVALERGASPDIWLLDVATGRARPFITNPSGDHLPVWSPDGEMLAFDSNYPLRDLFVRPVHGGTDERSLLKNQKRKVLSDWSGDNRYIAFTSDNDIWLLQLNASGAATPIEVTHTPAAEANPRMSPNARWMAYQSNESGRFEVYVDSFPTPTKKVRVSSEGGEVPRWSRDGRELFYLSREDLMVVPFDDDGGAAVVREPVRLFKTPRLPRASGPDASGNGRNYSVSSDGRILFNVAVDSNLITSPIIITPLGPTAFRTK